MPLILRREKEGPLTLEEVDENFESLDRRLQTLEQYLEQLGQGFLSATEQQEKLKEQTP